MTSATFLVHPGCVEPMQASSGLSDHLCIVHQVNVVHVWPACTTRRPKVEILKKRQIMLCWLPWASGWSADTQGAWQLTTATLGSAPSLLQFVFGLKRSALQNMVACFPSCFLATFWCRFQGATLPGCHSLSFGFLSDRRKWKANAKCYWTVLSKREKNVYIFKV